MCFREGGEGGYTTCFQKNLHFGPNNFFYKDTKRTIKLVVTKFWVMQYSPQEKRVFEIEGENYKKKWDGVKVRQ